MPKYFKFKVGGYYLYYTSFCLVEAFHAHAGDSRMNRKTAAKFWVLEDGSTQVAKRGALNQKELDCIQAFIKANYALMYAQWVASGGVAEFKNK